MKLFHTTSHAGLISICVATVSLPDGRALCGEPSPSQMAFDDSGEFGERVDIGELRGLVAELLG